MKGLLLFVAVCAVAIFGISLYLQPDDMRACNDGPDAKCAAADAIIVVSGGDTNARAQYGIELYKKGWADTLIFSGAAQDKSGPSNAAAMKRQALNAGVPADAIILDEDAVNTQQNAENTQSIVSEHHLERVILVTSGYHQRRASLEFNKGAGIEIVDAPVKHDKDWSGFWWLTPRGWWLAGGELVKIGAFYIGAGR